jgi:hypothetical protein
MKWVNERKTPVMGGAAPNFDGTGEQTNGGRRCPTLKIGMLSKEIIAGKLVAILRKVTNGIRVILVGYASDALCSFPMAMKKRC